LQALDRFESIDGRLAAIAEQESTTRQDAERQERSGEAPADASSVSSHLAVKLDSAAKAEREAEDAPELAQLEPTGDGRGSGGRGMF
jgi:hypothetical protein